jgi:HK97 gp10 family phage protein
VSSYVKDWRQDELMASIRRRITSGMGNACQFAVGQAKSKAPVRTGLLRSKIGYEVRAEPGAIVGRVGVQVEAKDSTIGYSLYQEMGTYKMPAHPYLRPAVFGNGPEIVRLIAKG